MSDNPVIRPARRFRDRVLERSQVFGTFVKTPTTHASEILGALGYDFLIFDAEHAAFDRVTLDVCILAARAAGTAPLVRVPSPAPEHLLGVLDSGAYGVMVPHVASPEAARDVVAACRYAGKRGFSNSPRAGDYGARATWAHLDESDREVLVLGMIEDPQAVDAIDEILAVEGLDAIFIGRGDLTAAYRDRAPDKPRVREATARVLDAARRHGKPVFLLASGPAEAATFVPQGASGFVISSDQGFLRSAAGAALGNFKSALSAAG